MSQCNRCRIFLQPLLTVFKMTLPHRLFFSMAITILQPPQSSAVHFQTLYYLQILVFHFSITISPLFISVPYFACFLTSASQYINACNGTHLSFHIFLFLSASKGFNHTPTKLICTIFSAKKKLIKLLLVFST